MATSYAPQEFSATPHERVDTWGKLEEFLFKDARDTDIGRVRTRRAFRGLQRSGYHLSTKLQRRVKAGKREEREHSMIRQFRKYAHHDLEAGSNVWHWLSIAQHHGLPTRLLDWTNSPLAGVYCEARRKEG